MLTGSVGITLPAAGDQLTVTAAIRRKLGALHTIPDGAALVVVVGDRLPSAEAVRLLSPHVHRLHITVQSEDPRAVRAWLDGLSHGKIAGVSGA